MPAVGSPATDRFAAPSRGPVTTANGGAYTCSVPDACTNSCGEIPVPWPRCAHHRNVPTVFDPVPSQYMIGRAIRSRPSYQLAGPG